MWPFRYPYTNFHELNLDWILKTVKENQEDIKKIKTAEAGNSEKPLAGRKMLVIGDSIAYGQVNIEGEAAVKPWPTVFSEITGAEVVNNSVPGRTTAQGLSIIRGVSLNEYDTVIFALGTNDIGESVPAETTRANILAFCDVVLSYPDTQMVITTPPVVGSYTGYNPAFYTLFDSLNFAANKKRCTLIDIRNRCGINAENLTRNTWDGLHPNQKGLYKIGKYVASVFPDNSVRNYEESFITGLTVTDNTETVTVTHNLGRIPRVIAFIGGFENLAVGFWTKSGQQSIRAIAGVYDINNTAAFQAVSSDGIKVVAVSVDGIAEDTITLTVYKSGSNISCKIISAMW